MVAAIHVARGMAPETRSAATAGNGRISKGGSRRRETPGRRAGASSTGAPGTRLVPVRAAPCDRRMGANRHPLPSHISRLLTAHPRHSMPDCVVGQLLWTCTLRKWPHRHDTRHRKSYMSRPISAVKKKLRKNANNIVRGDISLCQRPAIGPCATKTPGWTARIIPGQCA